MKSHSLSVFENRLKEILSKVTPKRKPLEERTDLSKEFVDFLSVLKSEISPLAEIKFQLPKSLVNEYVEQLSKIAPQSSSPTSSKTQTEEPSHMHPNSSLAFVADSMEFYDETSGDSGNSIASSQIEVTEEPISLDSDALAYINNVEFADSQQLENGVRFAINDFVTGCKADGIWNSFVSCCILAGARTLNGALVPLVGTAPSNINFVSADYNRLSLAGGTSKYLNSNVLDSSIARDNFHISIWQSQAIPSGSRTSIGVQRPTPYYTSSIIHSASNSFPRARNSSSSISTLLDGNSVGLFGVSRNNSATYNEKRPNNSIGTISNTSAAPLNLPYFVFSGNNNGSPLTSFNGKLSFYSIGINIDLSKLNTRVSTLLSSIGSAI